MKKNTTTKIMAIIALLGIILGVLSTGILILFETVFTPKTINQATSSKSEKIDLSSLLKNTGAINQTGMTK